VNININCKHVEGIAVIKANIAVGWGVSLAFVLSACVPGGSGSSSEGSSNTISGSVLGSYIVGAAVCIDDNGNSRCDIADSFKTTSSTEGVYSFTNVPDDVFTKAIVVEVPKNAYIVDPVTGHSTRATTAYRLIFPPSSDSVRFISSLSTLVNSEFMKTGDLESAKQTVSNIIGVGSPDDLLRNYVEKGTSDDATSDEIKLYNMSKYVGSTMQTAQGNTENDLAINASVLLQLVTEKVLEQIYTIESMARDANGIVSHEEAALFSSNIAQKSSLDISNEEIAAAEALASTSFDLGKIELLTINNIHEEGQAGWLREFFINFNLSQGTALSLEVYKSSIPESYEIGLYNESGNLVQAYGFNEPQWVEEDDLKFQYQLSNDGSWFSIFSRDYSQGFDAGSYIFELCTSGCSNVSEGGGQIRLGTKEIIAQEDAVMPLLNDLIALVDGSVDDGVNLYTSAGSEMSRNGNQVVFVDLSSIAVPVGASARVDLASDSEGIASSGAYLPTFYSGTTLTSFASIYVPQGQFDQFIPDELVVRLEVSDAKDYKDVSYISRTQYKALTDGIERRESFSMAGIFGIYSTSNNADLEGQEFLEGGEINVHMYIADGNPLVSLSFEDESGAIIGSELCLPDNMLATQDETASLSLTSQWLYHIGDGTSSAFEGCTQDIQAVFNLAPLTVEFNSKIYYNQSRVAIRPSYNSAYNVNYLDIWIEPRTDETDFRWSEATGYPSVNFMKDAFYLVAEFQNGKIQKYYINLSFPINNHDFELGTEDWNISMCRTDQENLRVDFDPAGWMSEEFEANELSLFLTVAGVNSDNNQYTDSFSIKPLLGAKSVILPARIVETLLSDLDVDDLNVELHVGDMDYYEYKKRTWRSFYYDIASRGEVEQAPDCVT
jgi:hypothetical protein